MWRWEALRAEYVAGGISQRTLAEKYGVNYAALRRRAREEGWTMLRRRGKAAAEEDQARREAEKTTVGSEDAVGTTEKIEDDGASDSQIALRVRRRMLMKLERMAEAMPSDAVTERKSQDDSAVSLFKLRDLTAAYKELTGDLTLEGEERETVRVIVDP